MGVPTEDSVLRRKQVFVLLESWCYCGAISGLYVAKTRRS